MQTVGGSNRHGDWEVADLRVGRLADFPRLSDADLGHALDSHSGAAEDVLALLVESLVELEDAAWG